MQLGISSHLPEPISIDNTAAASAIPKQIRCMYNQWVPFSQRDLNGPIFAAPSSPRLLKSAQRPATTPAATPTRQPKPTARLRTPLGTLNPVGPHESRLTAITAQ